ncbi:MAG: N-formylglutamate amidohydrolase [Prevotella sp.]|nr:N-formylglutamate amidohydrolase [Prevotella sp.]
MEHFSETKTVGGSYGNILLHIPHSSSSFPAASEYTFNDLDRDERLLIDYYTDALFLPQPETEHVGKAVFPYCRLYCDVERLVNDPLEKDGLGISYRSRGDRGLRSFSNLKEAFALYADFHAEVAKKIVELGEDVLLIDSHSFSSLPNLLNSNPPDIDICIGYNDDETCPGKVVIGNIVRHFESYGYKVGINMPFSNSKTFNVPVVYHSIMIEINKRLYMNEETLEKKESFMSIHQHLMSMYRILLKND